MTNKHEYFDKVVNSDKLKSIKTSFFTNKKGKVNIPDVANVIRRRLNYTGKLVVTNDNHTFYTYNGGYYEPNGVDTVNNLSQTLLKKYATEHVKREIVGYLRDDYRLRINRTTFDSQLNLINLKNGVYDIETNEFKDSNKDYYFTHQLPISYDPDAQINEIQQFFREVLYKKDIPVVQEMIGYCLYKRYSYHKAFMFNGEGRNGKSTLIDVITQLLGKNNVSSISLQELLNNRFSRVNLYNKHANLFADLPYETLKQTGWFKMLTGQDRIWVDVKFSKVFSFTNYAKLIFSANSLPKAYDETDAFFSRWILISFPNQFIGDKADENIIKKLTTQEELSGLLNWSIEGLKRLLEKGVFSNYQSIDEIRDEYHIMSDPVMAFISDRIFENVNGLLPKIEVYNAYKKFCDKRNLPVLANNAFGRQLNARLRNVNGDGRMSVNGEQVRCWRGIEFKE
ncbi:MAG: hypothetical protein KKC68_06645 [Candidatus Thermoplasmatota archaeon]|nr:hypothetical protein [Candidatus Thermoplasmatota archaeon]